MTHRHGSRVSRSDGLPRRIDFDDGSHIDYAYSADGEKLRVDYNLNPYTPAVPDGEKFGIACDSSQLVHTWREYAGNRVYEMVCSAACSSTVDMCPSATVENPHTIIISRTTWATTA